ncbi:RHS repeat-associated core domain-containing protein [Microbulbifer sp. 2304DJ12-6]|uniref:RHS repeat-associated core domain-containing protein n=1 Tax=Microbulbifer sp. 2304DJ12-6 TaxID=3233340 RepID=UPI0039B0B3BA
MGNPDASDPITHYQLQWSVGGSGYGYVPFVGSLDGSNLGKTTSVTISKANTGRDITAVVYKFRTRACNSSGCGAWSSIKQLNPPIPPTPRFSGDLPDHFYNLAQTITWVNVGANSYRLKRIRLGQNESGCVVESDGNCWRTVVDSTADTHYFDGASAPDSYRYKLYACNSFECKSVLSPWIKVYDLENPEHRPDNGYDIYRGDINGDGLDDLYFQYPRQIILLHGEVITPILLPASAEALNYVLYGTAVGGETGYLPPVAVTLPESVVDGLELEDRNVSYSNHDWVGILTESIVVPEDAAVSATTPQTHDSAVGALQGAGSVTGGAASYTIPITLPPGRNGLQPAISIGYSSRAGNGTLGMGWGLNAGSAISRCPQTIAQDGQMEPVQYLVSDRLCLDGQRLILVSGTYGYSGARYRTEQDTFARITQTGAINGSSTQFKVELKNGMVREYGYSADSRHRDSGVAYIKSWALTRERDSTANNTIVYEYASFSQGEHLLSKVFYTGSASSIGSREVEILYAARPDLSSAYMAGGLSRQTKRVSEVRVNLQGSLIRKYIFNYKQSASTGRSLIQSVQECGAGGVCQRPTNFSWNDAADSLVLETFGYSSYSASNHVEDGRTITPLFSDIRDIEKLLPTGDYNGDGVRDWLGRFVNAEGESVGNFTPPDKACANTNIYTLTKFCMSVDLNNDGLSDYWRKNNNSFQVAFAQSGGGAGAWFSTAVALVDADQVVHAADYNGDGWVDLFVRKAASRRQENYLDLYLHTGNPNNPYSSSGQRVAEFDYRDDCRCFRRDVQFMGDMDGNGLPDLIFNQVADKYEVGIDVGAPNFGQPIMAYIYYATANGAGVTFLTENASKITSGTNAGLSGYDFFYSMDINGDGLDDWLNWRSTGNSLYYRMNKGGGDYTSWHSAGSEVAMETRQFGYTEADGNDSAYYTSLKYDGALQKIDIGADGRLELLFPSTRIMTACTKNHHDGELTEFCGDRLYSSIDLDPSDFKESLANIRVHLVDKSIYQFDAIRFVEQTDGSFKAERVETDYIGSAYDSAVVDAFGNGLSDFVFTVGCPEAARYCRFSNRLPDLPDGTYLTRNRGSATGSELYNAGDMLKSSENALGVIDEWFYRPLSSDDDRYHSQSRPFYERGSYIESVSGSQGEGYIEFASSMYVVAEHRQSNGVNGLNKKQYRYKGAVFNSKGRGFQGFHTIIEEDLAADIETQSDFHQIFPLAGKLYKQRQWELGDRSADTSGVAAFKESNFEWQFWPEGRHASPVVVDALTDNWTVAANEPYFVGLDQQRTVQRTLNRSGSARRALYTQTQSNTFDRWGNVLAASSSYEEANSSHRVSSSTNTQYVAADQINWWINRPLRQTVTKHSIQSRTGVSIASGTDVQQSVVVDFLQWDSNARKPKRVKTTPSSGKWTQVDTLYNSYGLPTKVTTSAAGEAQTRVVETAAFSADGYFPKTVKNALGHTVTTATNAKFGQPDSVTDANGLTTRYTYDAFGRATQVTAPSALGLKTAPDRHTALQWCSSGCSRAPAAVFKTLQQQAGTPTQITYHDRLGRVIRTEVQAFDGSNWIARTVTYNPLGQTTYESVPHYAISGTSYGTRYLDYDTFGRALRKTVNQTNGQQLDVIYTHEQGSGFTTSIQVNGRTMSRTYNGLQQLTETVDALGGSTRYAYDGAGNPIVLQDAAGNRITAKYNALGQKDWVDDPNMGSKSFTYTGFGEVETEIDGNLDITSFTYDCLGRMDSRSVNGTEEARWIYDSATNGKGLPARESRSDANYARSYSYDALSRPYKVTTTIDGEDFATYSHFDSHYGRLKGLSYPSGLTLRYGYNDAGYQFRTSNAASGYSYREITQMDAWGEWSFANMAGGIYTMGRDFHNETGQMVGTAFDSLALNHQTLSYTYDAFGNLTDKTVGIPSQSPAVNSETYRYDALNRLDYSTRTGGRSIDYDYDAIGNLLKKDDFASSYRYTGGGSGGPSAVKSVSLVGGGSKTYGYDANGNRTHENGAQQVWYNAFNKPTRINRNGANLVFYYGADQMRYKQVNQGSGKTTLYIDKLFEKISTGAETKYRHFIGDIAVVTTTETGSSTSHEIGFTHRDRLGSTTAIGDHQGNLMETHSFDPFGKPRLGNILDKTPAILGSAFTTRGFTDHEHLDDVELIHMNGRAYDYNLGRFLSVDPIIQAPGNSQSLNPYSYIMNNPLAGTDPSGYTASCSVEDPGGCNDVVSNLGEGETADITQKQAVTAGSRIKQDVKVGTLTGNGNGTATASVGNFSAVVAPDIGGQSSRSNISGQSNGDLGSRLKVGADASLGAIQRFASDALYTVTHSQEIYFNLMLQWGLGTLPENLYEGVIAEGTAALDAATEGDARMFGNHAMGIFGAVTLRRGVIVKRVDPNTLQRTHSISGKRSSKKVDQISESMRNDGFVGNGIDVVEYNGQRFIIDGHHRAAAARRTGTKVNVNVVDDIANHPSSFNSIDDVLKSADSVGPDRLRPPR